MSIQLKRKPPGGAGTNVFRRLTQRSVLGGVSSGCFVWGKPGNAPLQLALIGRDGMGRAVWLKLFCPMRDARFPRLNPSINKRLYIEVA